MLSINQLEHLVALDDTRHFAKAADRVHLSQPAFSRSIQALERQVGLQFFERQGRKIQPTPAGAYFIERARLLVAQSKALQRDMGLYRKGEIGNLAFGVGPFPCATLAAPVTSYIREHHPQATIRVEVVTQATLHALLLTEEIEFYVADVNGIPAADYLSVTPIMRQYGYLYARKGHPLDGQTHCFEQAWRYGMATVKLPAEVQGVLTNLVQSSFTHKDVAGLECDDVNLLCQIALCTNTVVALTDLAYANSTVKHSLVKLQTTDFPPLFANIALVTLSGRTLSPIAQVAVDQFKRAGVV